MERLIFLKIPNMYGKRKLSAILSYERALSMFLSGRIMKKKKQWLVTHLGDGHFSVSHLLNASQQSTLYFESHSFFLFYFLLLPKIEQSSLTVFDVARCNRPRVDMFAYHFLLVTRPHPQFACLNLRHKQNRNYKYHLCKWAQFLRYASLECPLSVCMYCVSLCAFFSRPA